MIHPFKTKWLYFYIIYHDSIFLSLFKMWIWYSRIIFILNGWRSIKLKILDIHMFRYCYWLFHIPQDSDFTLYLSIHSNYIFIFTFTKIPYFFYYRRKWSTNLTNDLLFVTWTQKMCDLTEKKNHKNTDLIYLYKN